MKKYCLSIAAALMAAGFLCSCSAPKQEGDLISQNKGKIIVALMGMEGCPGTEAGTPVLAEYSKTGPAGVFVCRIDVPPPGKKLEKAGNVSAGLPYGLDNDRSAAEKVEFFFYPTTYVIDKDGEVRFAGECDIEKIKRMVSEISAEPAGGKKKMYTPKTLDTGAAAGDVSWPDADGNPFKLSSVCTNGGAILFFSTTTCPFSIKAVDDLERLKADFKTNKFNYAIVSYGQGASEVKDKYAEKSPGTIILIDADKKISSENFGVSAVPFFYVIGSDMKVVDRKPFVYDTAKSAIAKSLGVTLTGTNDASCGAGAG